MQNMKIVPPDSSWNALCLAPFLGFKPNASLGLVRLFQVEDMLVSLPGRDQVDPGVLLKSGPSSFRTYDGPFPFWA